MRRERELKAINFIQCQFKSLSWHQHQRAIKYNLREEKKIAICLSGLNFELIVRYIAENHKLCCLLAFHI